MGSKASTARRRGSTSARWRSEKKRWVQATPDVGQTLNNLANVYRDQGKYGEAEGLHKRALVDQGKGTRHKPSRRGRDPQQPGCVYRTQGKYGEAEELHKRALAIKEQAFGEGHPDVASTLTNLANLYRDQGKYGEAEGLYKRALAISEQALGASHPEWLGASTTWRSSMKLAVKAGARLPIRGRQRLPSLPIELPNRRVLHRRGR